MKLPGPLIGRALTRGAVFAHARKWHHVAVELAGAYAVFRGIAIWSYPSALIIAGIAAVVAIEVRAQ